MPEAFDDEPVLEDAVDAAPGPAEPERAPLELQPTVDRVDAFAAIEESVTPLIGSESRNLLAEGGRAMLWGRGGSGKTTISVDLACHLGAGIDWLGGLIPVGRPLRVLLIENEGPRGEFRKKLRRKIATWDGAPFVANVFVWSSPWGAVDLRHERVQESVAAAIDDNEIDVVVAGPVRRLGLAGGGTPEEVVAFGVLVDALHHRAVRPFGAIFVHHSNKGGDVSGAFDAEGDTIVRVTSPEKGRTILHFEKARFSSELHLGTVTLAWKTGSEGFDVVDNDIDTAAQEAKEAAQRQRDSDARTLAVALVERHWAFGRAPMSKSAFEDAFVAAHNGERGARALGRRIFDRLVNEYEHYLQVVAVQSASDPSTATRTASTPALAVANGEARNGKYLKPFAEASSPLAIDLNGEHGDQCVPTLGREALASSPPPIEIGGERRAPAEGAQEPQSEPRPEQPPNASAAAKAHDEAESHREPKDGDGGQGA